MKMNKALPLSDKTTPNLHEFKRNQKSASRSKRTMRQIWGTDQTVVGIRRFERNKKLFRYQWGD